MKERKNYASRLTKEDLIKSGITLVTEDCCVFKGEKQLTPSINSGHYFAFLIYVLDEDGNKIKVPIKRQIKGSKKISDTYVYKMRAIGLHRLMWAWFNNEVPEGYVVDHINNRHETLEDYHLNNLQLLTPAENVAKERDESTRQVYCSLKKPISFYENKLNNYLEQYEEAKKDHRADLVHKLRTNISDTKARIRYWKAHQEEVKAIQAEQEAEQKKLEAQKREYHERAQKKKDLKLAVKEAHRFFTEARDAYGKDDEVTLQRWGEWKLAIAMFQGFCAEMKTAE